MPTVIMEAVFLRLLANLIPLFLAVWAASHALGLSLPIFELVHNSTGPAVNRPEHPSMAPVMTEWIQETVEALSTVPGLLGIFPIAAAILATGFDLRHRAGSTKPNTAPGIVAHAGLVLAMLMGVVLYGTLSGQRNGIGVPVGQAFEGHTSSGEGILWSIWHGFAGPGGSSRVDTVIELLVVAVACIIIQRMMHEAASALIQKRTHGSDRKRITLRLTKPIFFLSVSSESFCYSFLSEHIRQAVEIGGYGPTETSMVFMAYFVGFGLTLVPAARWATERGAKSVLCAGLLLSAFGLGLLAISGDPWMLAAARLASGIGQALVLIAVQTLALASSSEGEITRGAGIIVTAFNGGMIAGIALGGLLVSVIGPDGVLFAASGISLITILLALATADARGRTRSNDAAWLRHILMEIVQALRLRGFLGTTLMIGIPAKATLTGALLYAVPLATSRLGANPADIGHLLVLYSVGVMLTSSIVAQMADEKRGVHGLLTLGCLVSASGLAVVGMADLISIHADASTAMLAAAVGLAVIGIGHGFVNAPVITHVATLGAGTPIGSERLAATYRLLERAGHAVGPLIAGQMLVMSGGGSQAFMWMAGLVAASAMLFIPATMRMRAG